MDARERSWPREGLRSFVGDADSIGARFCLACARVVSLVKSEGGKNRWPPVQPHSSRPGPNRTEEISGFCPSATSVQAAAELARRSILPVEIVHLGHAKDLPLGCRRGSCGLEGPLLRIGIVAVVGRGIVRDNVEDKVLLPRVDDLVGRARRLDERLAGPHHLAGLAQYRMGLRGWQSGFFKLKHSKPAIYTFPLFGVQIQSYVTNAYSFIIFYISGNYTIYCIRLSNRRRHSLHIQESKRLHHTIINLVIRSSIK